MPEAAADPHLAARADLHRPATASSSPRPSPRFSRTPGALADATAHPGQDTTDALTEWGLTDVADLIASGAAVQS